MDEPVALSLLPLFPLPMVVGPGESAALHIFEPRYKKMMRDIRAEAAPEHALPFGLCLFREKKKEIAEIGCTVLLRRVVRAYEDGRMDVVGHGQQRFRVLEVNREAEYARGRVEYFADLPHDVDPDFLRATREAMAALLREAKGHDVDITWDTRFPASFQMAHDAGLELEQKYKLLCMRDENERLDFLRKHARRAMHFLEKARALKTLIEQNGHFREFPEIKF